MDEQQRQLRRAAAEEFMRSLEQLGEMLDEEETANESANELPGQASAEADLSGALRLDLDFGTSYGRRPQPGASDSPTRDHPTSGTDAAESP
mgnify:CR=1 FL=1